MKQPPRLLTKSTNWFVINRQCNQAASKIQFSPPNLSWSFLHRLICWVWCRWTFFIFSLRLIIRPSSGFPGYSRWVCNTPVFVPLLIGQFVTNCKLWHQCFYVWVYWGNVASLAEKLTPDLNWHLPKFAQIFLETKVWIWNIWRYTNPKFLS
jgi:hypothetical protein